MPGLADLKKESLIKALVFGKFKTGKTAGAATFPRTNFIDFDKGIITLANKELEEKYKYSARGIMYETFEDKDRSPKGVVRTHNAFDDACRYFDACMSKGAKWKSPSTGLEYQVGVDMFDTWVVDSGSTLSAVARNKALILLGTKDNGLGTKSNTQDAALKTGLIVPKMQDFGAERSMVEQFCDMVYKSGKNFLLLCHEREFWEGEGDAAKVVGIGPLFTGQSAELIPIKFDEVYNLRTKKEGPKDVRYLQTKPDGLRACGSRLGVPDGTVFEYEAIKKALNL